MKTWLSIAVCALVLAGPASAYHAFPNDPHWPTTTVQVNGGSCGWAKPECRWLRIIDRTGYGATWQNTILPNALEKLAAATGNRFNFTTARGTRFDLWTPDGQYHWAEAAALTPVGAVFVGRNAYQAFSLNCETNGPQPYCGTNPNHRLKAVVGAGSGPGDSNFTFQHEMGHTFGLDHRTCTDGHSIMCGIDEWLTWDAHDKAELNRLYGHVT